MLKEAKDAYRRKVEQKLQENNMREVWDGMKTITGCKKSSGTVEGNVVRANQLNHFYNRFDNPAPGGNDCLTPCPASPPSAPSAAVTCSLQTTTPSPSHPRAIQLYNAWQKRRGVNKATDRKSGLLTKTLAWSQTEGGR